MTEPTKITTLRLTAEERETAEQIAVDAGLPAEIANGVRVALKGEAKRRKLTPRKGKGEAKE